jgi:hypothetical protein
MDSDRIVVKHGDNNKHLTRRIIDCFFFLRVLIMDKPQIILHSQKSVNYTVFDVKWIPTSAKFISLGNHARGTGALDIFEITHGDIALVSQVERKKVCFFLE